MKINVANDYVKQAAACAKNNDNTGAVANYRRALELDDEQPAWVYNGLGHQLLMIKHIDEAEQVFLAAREKFPSQQGGLVGLAAVAQLRRMWDLANDLWNECFAKFPQHARVHWYNNKAKVLIHLGRHEDAEVLLQTLCETHPDQPHGWIKLAELAKFRRNWTDALRHWSVVVDKFPDNLKARLQKGDMLMRLDRVTEAKEVFALAMEKWPKTLAVMQAMIRLARKQNDYALILTQLDALLKSFPNNISANIEKAILLARTGNFRNAEILLNKIFRHANQNVFSNDIITKLFVLIQHHSHGIDNKKFLRKLLDVTNEVLKTRNDPQTDMIAAELSLALGDYGSLSESVSKLYHNGHHSASLRGLSKVLRKYNSPKFPDYSAPKIFGIGLSKTATTSLNNALLDLGIHSIHWFNPHTKKIISNEDILLFEGFTDICISYQFEMLYHTFPNSKFVYTTRSLESWTRSIAAHYYKFIGAKGPSELRAQRLKKRLDGIPAWAEMNLYAKYDSWEEAYIEYDLRVRKFFKDKPPEKFLEMNICEGHGWEELCGFLGKDIPETPFPMKNKTSMSIHS